MYTVFVLCKLYIHVRFLLLSSSYILNLTMKLNNCRRTIVLSYKAWWRSIWIDAGKLTYFDDGLWTSPLQSTPFHTWIHLLQWLLNCWKYLSYSVWGNYKSCYVVSSLIVSTSLNHTNFKVFLIGEKRKMSVENGGWCNATDYHFFGSFFVNCITEAS